MPRMGLDFGLQNTNLCAKHKFRWLFVIPSISGDKGPRGVNSLPPVTGARPSLSFKEIQAEHLNETIYYPGKPDWKPVELSLYDLSRPTHPVFSWLQRLYSPSVSVGGGTGRFRPPLEGESEERFIVDEAYLELYDGCGNVLEQWVYESVWPQTIEFGELDMGNSEIVTCDLTLRYARAYLAGQ